MTDGELVCALFERVAEDIAANQDEGSVMEVFGPVLGAVKEKAQKDFTLGHSIIFSYLDLMLFFIRKQCLAEVSFPKSSSKNASELLTIMTWVKHDSLHS